MSKPPSARYRTTNWSIYNAELRRLGSMLIWVDQDMGWLAPHEGRSVRPPVFSDAAIQFCRCVKVLFRLPLRQTAGMVASLLRLVGLNWSVPEFSTLCRRQKALAVQIPYRRIDGPFNLFVPSRDHAAHDPVGQRVLRHYLSAHAAGGSSTLSPSWTGTSERSWLGGSRTRWRPTSGNRPIGGAVQASAFQFQGRSSWRRLIL